MSLYDVLQSPRNAEQEKIGGVAIAQVTNNQGPEGAGRVKVKYPWRNDEDESQWATPLVTKN